ncbi:hypothetical protein JW879_01035 [candidate division WOR-3 bacterium]|nr:hypothetical protein [candidate division WOR-3 bacterium]
MSDEDKKTKIKASKKDIDDGKSIAWLSYLGLLLLIPLLVKPENTFCKHHAKQGIVLLGLWIAVSIISPFISVLDSLAFLAIAVISIIGIVQSLSGNYWKAPLGIYQLSEKFKI